MRLTYEHALTDDEDADLADMFVAYEPSLFKEARKDVDYDKCQAAMTEEMEALREHDTWTLVPPSTVHQKLIDCRWVFKVKPATRATTERYKARLVAKGFQKRKVVDCNETFAPVAKSSSIRLLPAHAHSRNLFVSQVNVGVL